MARYSKIPELFESSKSISITKLKKLGLLYDKVHLQTNLHFTRNGKEVGSITIKVNTSNFNPYIEFNYNFNGTPVNYKLDLIKQYSNLGKGYFWLFNCRFTNKLCRKLYLHNGYFKHYSGCYGYFYEQQTLSKRNRYLSKIFEVHYSTDRIIYNKYFKSHYAGKPTKKYKAYLKKLNSPELISIENILAGGS